MEKTRSPSLIHLRTLKRDTCVHFTRPFATQQHRSKPSLLQKYGVKCNSALEVHDVDELKQRLIDVWRHFEQSAIDDSWLISGANVSAHEFVWNENLLTLLTHKFCVSCLLSLWTLIKCCVKCSRISQISVSYLSQGCAATHLRCDGNGFCCKFLGEYNSVRISKSVNICKSYKRMYSGTVFLTHGVYRMH